MKIKFNVGPHLDKVITRRATLSKNLGYSYTVKEIIDIFGGL